MKIEHILLFAGAVMLSCLSALYALSEKEGKIPDAAKFTAILGGGLGGVMAIALQLHFYGWAYPWLILGLSIPAGFGAPLLIATMVRVLAKGIESIFGNGN